MYDLIIIGAGPAGLAAGLYAGRYKMKTLILGEQPGGAILEAHKVCNFPTYEKIPGPELAKKMVEQVKKLGVEIKKENAVDISKKKNFKVKTKEGDYQAKKIIIATGTKQRKLGLPKEDELIGKGVSYCATCDASFFLDKVVAVLGGGNAALTAALLLTEYAKKVYIIYRRKEFSRPEQARVEEINQNKKIETLFETNITELIGKERLEAVKLDNDKKLKVDGLFIEIGHIPTNHLTKKLEIKTKKGYIITDEKQKTNIPGVYAAGDITKNVLKQVITAAAEGSIAAYSAYQDLRKEHKK